ncbi:MAG: hypothetical protein CSA72_10605 [Rhodobacterales bacterium]|nr:MAG: hypothetical protein CSA72_10605 [Rhodobacterales bacterium]
MPYTPLTQFDPARIPDTNDEVNFHADATYVWGVLAGFTIPELNANFAWMAGALVGDTATLLDSVNALTAMFDGTALFDMPVVVKAAPGGNANVWLKNETEKNQGVVYWDRNLDQVVIAAYSADGSTQAGQVRISTTEASWNGHEFWHENNAAIQTIQGVKGRKAFLKNNSGGTLVYGAEVDGSQLSYASISSAGTVVSSGVPPGRWACLGWAPAGSGCEYVRVS